MKKAIKYISLFALTAILCISLFSLTGFAKGKIVFKDVPAKAYYYDAVEWAVENNITNGMGENTFMPDVVCTRGQVVCFLWRLDGQRVMESQTCPFKDVKSKDYFYDAVLWAVSKSITNGVSADTFAPNATVTREQFVTFLWRYAGQPDTEYKCNFKDVSKKEYYFKAVCWAAEKGITTGVSNTEFGTSMSCSRANTVTFIFRYANLCKHTETEIVGQVDATCTEDGYTGDVCCKNCHKIMEKGSVTLATHHQNTRIINAVEPDENNNGYSGDVYCDDCKTIIEYGHVALYDAPHHDLCTLIDYTENAMPSEEGRERMQAFFDWYKSDFEGDYDINELNYLIPLMSESHNSFFLYNFVYYSYYETGDPGAKYAFVLNWVGNIIDALGIDESTKQWDAIDIINEFLCDFLEYDDEAVNIDAYDAINSGRGVCSSYARLFQLMTQYCGIETYYIEEDDINHGFNYVVFSDGTVLYVDVTWNDAKLTFEGDGWTEELKEKAYREYRRHYLLLSYQDMYDFHRHIREPENHLFD